MKTTYIWALLFCLTLTACGGNKVVRRTTTDKPPTAKTSDKSDGGYYLDDGPGANPPKNIDDIPDAIPKIEAPSNRSNKPYKALGKTYYPLKTAANYKERGMASWYGKRYHGKNTSNGEVYNMYSMSAAHTVLPLPSYVKVTNVANGRSVVVRINDRGPFIDSRVIDLSYAAAYKLRIIEQGSGLVDVEVVQPGQTSETQKTTTTARPTQTSSTAVAKTADTAIMQFHVQAGAFQEEGNAKNLLEKIQAINTDQNVNVKRVYNSGLHRLLIGPYNSRLAAEQAADNLRQQINIPTTIITH